MLSILLILSLSISTVFGGSCASSKWNVDYSSDKCSLSSGTYKMKCAEKGNTGTCGMRMSSKAAVGKGSYSAKIKAAPGSGMNTALYLFSYGRNNDKSKAWNEIDIEILGEQISGGKTKIWTNVWTGYYTQHYQLVTVPWDASTGYHTYKIKIDGSKIYWIFDGKTYRTFKYTGYSDLKSTIKGKDFQVLMALWGSNDNSWSEMGSMWSNSESYPLYGYFKSVSIDGSSFTEDDGEATADPVVIVAVVIVSVLFICALIAGVIYFRRRRKKANGDGASFKGEEVPDTEDSKQATGGDTPISGERNETEAPGYDMDVINTEPEVEVNVDIEQQA